MINDLAQHVKKIDTLRVKQGGSRIVNQKAIENKYRSTTLSPFLDDKRKGKEKEAEAEAEIAIEMEVKEPEDQEIRYQI